MEKESKLMPYVPGEIPLKECPNIENIKYVYPKEICIAFAVCGKDCGHKEFIVDGGTQICPCCGRNMFRTETKMYLLSE